MVQYVEPNNNTCVPSDIYPYIYHFLVDNGLIKTAKYFKKETGAVLHKPTGLDIIEIFSKHVCLDQKVTETTYNTVPLVYDDVCANKTEEKGKKSKKKKRKLVESISENDNYKENEDVKPKKKKKEDEKGALGEESNSIETQNSIIGEDVQQSPLGDKILKKKKKKKQKDNLSEKLAEILQVDSATKIDSVEETVDTKLEEDEKLVDMENVSLQSETKHDKKLKKKKKTKKDTYVEEVSVQNEVTPEEKTKMDIDDVVDEHVMETETGGQNNVIEDQTDVVPVTKKIKKNESFRRVISESVIIPQQLQDNSFEGKAGSRGDWGEKANQDLKFTKGKSFRHEKTKKKRGSYRGGNINTSVNSIKFGDSDNE